MTNVNPKEYQSVRETIGSQRDVARLLGVDIRTVQRREAGEIVITFEATRALFCLSAIERLRGLTEQIKSDTVRHELDDVVVLLEAH